MKNDIEEIRERFQADRFATETTGCIIEEAEGGHAICSLVIEPRHRNVAGMVMGGAIFTLADFAFAVAANTDRPLTISLNNEISFLSVAKGSKLIAEAVCVKDGRQTCYYRMDVKDDLGNLVAVMTGNGFKKI